MGIVDSSSLIRAQRDVKTPFDLRVKRADGTEVTVCFLKILRLLPGKRIVALAHLGGKQILVKTFLGRTAKRYAVKEQAGVEHIISAGVRTPQLLWQAELLDGSGQMLAFEYITPSVSLQSCWDSAEEDTERLDVLTRAMIIIAKLHNQGVVQKDIHLDNFLMSEKRIYTIDGGGVVREASPPLLEAESLVNLSWFFAQFFPKFDEFVQMVMPAYEAIRGWKQDPERLLRLHEDISRSRDSRKKNYLEKVTRDCTRFACESSFKQFLVYERDQFDEDMAALLADPDAFIDRGEILKDGNSATVVLVKLANRSVVVKRYNIKGPLHRLKRAVQKSRAWKSWLNSYQLEFLGIRSLKPVAMMEKRFGPLRSKAYFITEYVAAPDALAVLPGLKNPDMQTEALVVLLRLLSESKIAHGDLKATNFLMSDEGPVIIDLDAMREYKNNESFKRAFRKDLARFMKNWENEPQLEMQFHELLAKLSS